jgi:hypothetical protein
MVRFCRLLYYLLLAGIRKIIDFLILKLPIYYTRMDKISIAKWFDVMDGKVENLYKFTWIKWIPAKFIQIVDDMYFQLENVNTEIIKQEAELAILYSQAARTGNKMMEFKADGEKKKLDDKKTELAKNKTMKLNAFLNVIELTLNYQNIDPDKMKASRAFSLYHIAVERNKELEQKNKS